MQGVRGADRTGVGCVVLGAHRTGVGREVPDARQLLVETAVAGRCAGVGTPGGNGGGGNRLQLPDTHSPGLSIILRVGVNVLATDFD